MVGKQRNFGLDLVRAISILLVLAAHRFKMDFELGVVGVQIFFVLSGFLIGQILINDFKNGGTIATVFKFWKRRWYRTLPMYYLILTIKILFYGNPYGWKIIVYYFFLQANFVGIDFFPVSWSLVVEEWFYIFLPLATLLFFSKGIKAKRFLAVFTAFIIFFLAVRFAWNFLHKGLIIYQFDCLLLGVLLAILKVFYPGSFKLLNSRFLFIFGFAGIVFFTILLGDVNQIPLYSPFYRVVWYFLISICIALMIPYAEMSAFFNTTVKNIKPLYFFFSWTSILTYSIYLVHGDIFLLHFQVPEIISVFLHLLIVYSISFVFYSLYEHPMMSLRDNFSLNQYFQSARSSTFRLNSFHAKK